MANRTYFGFRLTQRSDPSAVSFFVFHAHVKDLRQWAGVRRTAESPKGSQRVLKPTRSRAVSRFLEADAINVIPNNILVAFNYGTTVFTPLNNEISQCLNDVDVYNGCPDKVEWGSLSFSFELDQQEHERLALIVDGQHRVYGMEAFSQEDIPVVVVGLLDASLQEQAFQFIVINKKAVSVQTSDAKSIIANFTDEEGLEARLSKVRVDYGSAPALLRYINDTESSPFYRLIAWSYNREPIPEAQLVPENAIDQSLKYIRNVFPSLEDDDDSLVDFFCAVWRVVKDNYPELWGINPRFMTKVNIVSLNEYLVDGIKSAWSLDILQDILELDQVSERILIMITKLQKEFWLSEWPPVKDNSNYRALIKGDLETMADNSKLQRSWHENLRLPTLVD